MPNNKVVLGDDVLIDISGDTVTPAVLLKGCTAHDKTGVAITGEMPDQGTKTATLDTSTTSYTIPEGKHSGSGKVSITTQEKSVTPSTSAQTVTPDSGKVLSKVTVGAVASATQATPEITVDSAGKITASATQEAGYVAAGTKSATKQMTTKGATTVTPTTSEQTIVDAGTYVTGAIKVAASTGKTVYKGSATYSGRYSPIKLNVGRTIQDGDDVYVIVDGGYIGPFCLCAARISGNKYGITTDGYRTLYKVSENPDTFSVSGSWIELYGQSMSTITGMGTSITCYWVIIR